MMDPNDIPPDDITRQKKWKTEFNLRPERLPVGIKMDHCLWSNLPPELLELSLSFLPLVALCRFRITCRRWNNLLCSPEFGKLYVVNAARNASERACLVVNEKVGDAKASIEMMTMMSRWSILDLGEKKWYNLKPDLPWCNLLLDMAGGLVCTAVPISIVTEIEYTPKTLTVFNPFGGAAKVLPDPPFVHDYAPDLDTMTLKLIVDSNSDNFKVLLTVVDRNPAGRFPFYIYESSTDQWTTARMPPFVKVHEGGTLSRVVFRGLLYCCSEYCFDNGWQESRMLWSFNSLDGSWEDTGVCFPSTGILCRDLVVIDNRLLVTNFQEEGSDLLLEIREILLTEKITRTVVQTRLSNAPKRIEYFQIRAFGFNRSKLLLCMRTGQVVMYDLVAGEWEWLPSNPVHDAYYVRDLIAGRMDYFRLPTHLGRS